MRTDVANFFGFLIYFGLWGVYLAIFAGTMGLVRYKASTKMTSPVIISIIVIFLLNWVSTVISSKESYEAYFEANGKVPSAGGTGAMKAINDSTLFISVLIADGALGWRCYIIWGRDRRVLVTACIWIFAGAVGVICTLAYDFLLNLDPAGIDASKFNPPFKKWSTGILLLSMAYNWGVSGMIIGRLWWADRYIKRHCRETGRNLPKKDYVHIIVMLVESGAVYTVYFFLFMLTWVLENEAMILLLDKSLVRIVGIYPTLIQLQRSLGYLQPAETATITPAEPLSHIQFAAAPRRRPANIDLSFGSTITGQHGGANPHPDHIESKSSIPATNNERPA